MSITDAKVYAFNAASFVLSFTTIEDAMKLALLAASLGYTIHKWYLMHKDEGAKWEYKLWD